jgi:hypothetical protein
MQNTKNGEKRSGRNGRVETAVEWGNGEWEKRRAGESASRGGGEGAAAHMVIQTAG